MSGDGDRDDLWRAIRELRGEVARLDRENESLWQDIENLRDELHAESVRVTEVHTRALKALTDALSRRPEHGNTSHT